MPNHQSFHVLISEKAFLGRMQRVNHAVPSSRTVLPLLLLLAVLQFSEALRGSGLPNRELFAAELLKPEHVQAEAKQAQQYPHHSTRLARRSLGSSSTNTTGLTMSGLQQELSGIKDKVAGAEQRHSKATIIAAATIGSLLLATLLGCAGALIYSKFVASQHPARRKGPKLPYYDADRLLGGPAGL